jgi:hypothetical protein
MGLVVLSPAAAGQDPPPPAAASPAGPEALGTTVNSHTRFEGTIRSIDPVAKAIRASGTQLNSRPMVLQVVDQTQIQVDGHPSSFTALRLGDVIRASYEDRYGIKVTRSIDVRSKSRSGAGADRR